MQPILVEVDHIFKQSSTQEQIFSSCVANAIDDILQVCMSLLVTCLRVRFPAHPYWHRVSISSVPNESRRCKTPPPSNNLPVKSGCRERMHAYLCTAHQHLGKRTLLSGMRPSPHLRPALCPRLWRRSYHISKSCHGTSFNCRPHYLVCLSTVPLYISSDGFLHLHAICF